MLHIARHSKVKAEILKLSPQERASEAKEECLADLVPQRNVRGTLGTPRKSGKAETEEVSADFWLLLFRDKSDPRRDAEYPQ